MKTRQQKVASAKPNSGAPRRPVVIPVSGTTGGTLPGIDLNDTAALIDAMEPPAQLGRASTTERS